MLELVLVRMHAAEDHIILHLEFVALTALPLHLDLRCLWMEFRLPDGATLPDPLLQVTLVHFSISCRIQKRGENGYVLPVLHVPRQRVGVHRLMSTHSFGHSS